MLQNVCNIESDRLDEHAYTHTEHLLQQHKLLILPIEYLCKHRNAISSEKKKGSITITTHDKCPVIWVSRSYYRNGLVITETPAGFEKLCWCLGKGLNVSFQEKSWG